MSHEKGQPGVDLVYYGQQQQLEYDFRVAPGSDPSQIKLAFEGAQTIETDAQGDLVLHTKAGDVRQHKPVVYQEVDGAKREIPSRYVMTGGQRVGFQVDAYDTSKPLVIDPVLSYSSFLGGDGDEIGYGVAVDTDSNIYVTGRTGSSDFPLVRPAQGDVPLSTEAFVTKLNAAGMALVYSTYLGGHGLDEGDSISIDAAGNAYVTGVTAAADFPVVNPLQATLKGSNDAFVTKLSARGSALSRPLSAALISTRTPLSRRSMRRAQVSCTPPISADTMMTRRTPSPSTRRDRPTSPATPIQGTSRWRMPRSLIPPDTTSTMTRL